VAKYAGFYDGMWAKLGEKYGTPAVAAAHADAQLKPPLATRPEGTAGVAVGRGSSGAAHGHRGSLGLPASAWADDAVNSRHAEGTAAAAAAAPLAAAGVPLGAAASEARPARSPVVVARVRAHQRRAADLYQEGGLDDGGGCGDGEPARGVPIAVAGAAAGLGEYEAYDALGPSASRPSSSAASDVSAASGHWAGAAGRLRTPPLGPLRTPGSRGAHTNADAALPLFAARGGQGLPPSEPSSDGSGSARVRPQTPHSARSLPGMGATPGGSASSPDAAAAAEQTHRRAAERSAEKEAAAARAWGLADPLVARAAVARAEALGRGERDAAQRAKEADPAFRYRKLMKAVAHNAAAAAEGGGSGGGGSGGAVERQRRQRAAAAAAPAEAAASAGPGATWGAAGTSVVRDRARHQQRSNAKKRPPAWATMPPIDPKGGGFI
jgi:hypothetical protein